MKLPETLLFLLCGLCLLRDVRAEVRHAFRPGINKAYWLKEAKRMAREALWFIGVWLTRMAQARADIERTLEPDEREVMGV